MRRVFNAAMESLLAVKVADEKKEELKNLMANLMHRKCTNFKSGRICLIEDCQIQIKQDTGAESSGRKGGYV